MLLSFLFTLLPCLVFGISISSPSASDYWVQFHPNAIVWAFNSSSDPSTFSIIITNPDPNQLNGAFSIAEFVPAQNELFLITNVTLKVGSGYNVVFYNPSNTSDIYTTSDSFSVLNSTTPPANVSATQTTAAPTSTGASSNGTSPAQGTAPASAATRLSLTLVSGLISLSSIALAVLVF